MRQKNRRRSLLTLYHHHGNSKHISSVDYNHNDNHLLHSDKSTYTNTYFYKYKSKLHKLVSLRLGPQTLTHTSIPLLVSGFGLLMLLGTMISPSISVSEKVNAEEGLSTQADGMSVQLALKDPEVNTLTTQAETGKVNYISKGFTVTTANVDGYNVYVQTAPGASNKLQNGNITIDFVKTEDTAPANFTDNSWGYKVDSTGTTPENLTYSPVPEATATNLNPAYSSKSTGETRDFTLNFAAKFASSATPGHYGTDVVLSVAAGAYEVAVEFPKWTISNMQDMNSTICANAKENTTGQLTDLRDGKQYWVTKLKDGNCWMTQNLDFDLKQGQALTPELSDVQTDWTPGEGEGTIATGNLNSETWPINDSLIRSYDPGEYINIQPTNSTPCGENRRTTTLENCAGWKNYNGKTMSNNPNFGNEIENNTYNAHYTVGNYYNYNAATAGTGLSVGNGDNNTADGISKNDATGSICPKGWQLPYSGRTNFVDTGEAAKDPANNIPINRNKSFINLLESYGWNDWTNRDVVGNPFASGINTTINGTSVAITDAPLYVIYGGLVESTVIAFANQESTYWSITSVNKQSGYRLLVTRSGVFPAINYGRYGGFSVRCVAK